MTAPRNPAEYRRSFGIRPYSPAFEAATLAIWGHELTRDQEALFAQASGGRKLRPGVGWSEAFLNCGRGSGKDDWLKSAANFECRYGQHELAGSPGQRLPFLLICPVTYQAIGTHQMSAGEARLPMNRRHLVSDTREAIVYRNGTSIVVRSSEETHVLGDSAIGIGLNEWAFMTNARELEQLARPALRRVIGAPPKRLFKLSSSYVKDGPPWECVRDNFGRDESDVLVLRGPTTFWNPNTDPAWLASERKALGDLLYSMHFENEWIDAVVESWFPADALGRARQEGKHELACMPGTPVVISADAAFSANGDKFGWSVASHTAGDWDDATRTRGRARVIVHACGAWRADREPREMAKRLRDEVCRRFGSMEILLDQYCAPAFVTLCKDVGLKPRVIFWKGGESADEETLSKVQRYRSFRTAMASGDMLLPDSAELFADLRACRGALLPGGGERVEVPRTARGHGDVLSATVMAATEAMAKRAALPASVWSFEEYLEAKSQYFSGYGYYLSGSHKIFNAFCEDDGRNGVCLSYPELRRRLRERLPPFEDGMDASSSRYGTVNWK